MSLDRTVTRHAFLMSGLFLGARCVAALVPVAIARLFGINLHTDVFFLSYSILFFFVSALSQALTVVVVPHLLAVGPSRREIERFIGAVLVWTTAVCGAAIVLVVAGAFLLGDAVGRLGVGDVKGFQALLLTGAPLILFSGWSSALAGLCNARKRFVLPAVSQIMKSLVTLLVIAVAWRTAGIAAAMIGYVLAEVLGAVFLYFVGRRELPRRIVLGALPRGFLESLVWYGFFCVFTLGNAVVYRLVAASLPAGSISLIEFSTVGFNAIYGLLLFGYAAVLPSYWAENVQKSGAAHFRAEALRFGKRLAGVGLVLTAVIRLSIGVFREELGNSPWGQSHHSGVLFGFFSIHLVSLVPAIVTFAAARYLVVLGRSARLIVPAVLATLVNVVASSAAAARYGIEGIGWSIVGSQTVLAIMLLVEALRSKPRMPETRRS